MSLILPSLSMSLVTVLVVCGEIFFFFSYNLVFVLFFDVLNPTVFILFFYYKYFYMDDQICDF